MSEEVLKMLKRGIFPGKIPLYLVAKNEPDRTAQEEIESHCRGLTATQLEELGGERGFAACIYMRTPDTIALVPNNKTRTGVLEFAGMWDSQVGLPKEVKRAWQEYCQYATEHGADEAHKMRRGQFSTIKRWVIQKRKDLVAKIYEEYGKNLGAEIVEWADLKAFKPDKLGFMGGKIYDWEKFLFGPAYPLEACAREAREEGGIHPLWSMLVHTNVEDPDATFEQWFFWIIEATDLPKSKVDTEEKPPVQISKEGVKGETDPPIEIEISRLNQDNFYWSHAQVLIKHLKWLVEVAGQAEYLESYNALRRNFGVSFRRVRPVVAPEKPIEVADTSWESVMQSVTRPRQLAA
jgi:hypothetical protein